MNQCVEIDVERQILDEVAVQIDCRLPSVLESGLFVYQKIRSFIIFQAR